jgi:hypothetical protein
MTKRPVTLIILFSAIALFSGACLMDIFGTPANPDAVSTAVWETAYAAQTQTAVQSLVAQLTKISEATSSPLPPSPTSTETPTSTSTSSPIPPTETETPTPTETPVPPTNTPKPTHTPIPPTATDVPLPCYKIGTVKDITIPDNADLKANADFTKTWRLYNGGSCSWKSDFQVYFVSGNAMSSPAHVHLDDTASPGEYVDVSIDMIAPDSTGSFAGYWKMRSSNGISFGWGSSADSAFWIKIDVKKPVPTHNPDVPVNFVKEYCLAEWRTSAGKLDCPSSAEDFSDGSIQRKSDVRLEGNYLENEYVLETIPSSGSDGVISGKYPAFTIEAGDEFAATIGCLDNSPKCNVKFQLNYSISGGSVHNLASWNQKDDGSFEEVSVDLSSLEGENVRLYLTVLNNGSSTDDRAFWLAPRIIR